MALCTLSRVTYFPFAIMCTHFLSITNTHKHIIFKNLFASLICYGFWILHTHKTRIELLPFFLLHCFTLFSAHSLPSFQILRCASRAFTNTILYCFTLFSAHSLPSFQILRRASRAFTNTNLYWFTLFLAHSLPSFQILQRALRELQQFEPFLHFYIQPQNWGGGPKNLRR